MLARPVLFLPRGDAVLVLLRRDIIQVVADLEVIIGFFGFVVLVSEQLVCCDRVFFPLVPQLSLRADSADGPGGWLDLD